MKTVKFKYDIGDLVSYAGVYGVRNTRVRACVWTGSGYLFYMTEDGQTKAENELFAGHDTAKYRPVEAPKKAIRKLEKQRKGGKSVIKKVTKEPAKKAVRKVEKKSPKKVTVKKVTKKAKAVKVIKRKR